MAGLIWLGTIIGIMGTGGLLIGTVEEEVGSIKESRGFKKQAKTTMNKSFKTELQTETTTKPLLKSPENLETINLETKTHLDPPTPTAPPITLPTKKLTKMLTK